MIGDTVGYAGVGGRSEVDRATKSTLLLKILKEFAIVGEVRDVELDGLCQMAFEGGFTLEKPSWKIEKGEGLVTGDGERRVVESVGLDEGTVKVDTENRQRGVVD